MENSQVTLHRGSMQNQLPIIRAAGKAPLDISKIMELRLQFRDLSSEKAKEIWNQSISCCDGVIYLPNDRIRFVRDSDMLYRVEGETKTVDGALHYPKENLEMGMGDVMDFDFRDLKSLNTYLSEKEVSSNPVWQFFARHQDLLDEYAAFVFKEGKKHFGYGSAMGIFGYSTSLNQDTGLRHFRGSSNGTGVEIRPLKLDPLVSRSSLCAYGNLHSDKETLAA